MWGLLVQKGRTAVPSHVLGELPLTASRGTFCCLLSSNPHFWNLLPPPSPRPGPFPCPVLLLFSLGHCLCLQPGGGHFHNLPLRMALKTAWTSIGNSPCAHSVQGTQGSLPSHVKAGHSLRARWVPHILSCNRHSPPKGESHFHPCLSHGETEAPSLGLLECQRWGQL